MRWPGSMAVNMKAELGCRSEMLNRTYLVFADQVRHATLQVMVL